MITLGGAPVTWRSKIQSTVSLSTMEAEFKSITLCVSIAIWFKIFLQELRTTIEKITIFNDNQAAITTTKSNAYKGRAKHCEVHFQFTRQNIKKNGIEIKHIKSDDNIADILTKQVGPTKLKVLKTKMNLISP